MPQSRQLAAIMVTDIVGYTALMGKDEQKSFTILNKNRSVQKPIIKQRKLLCWVMITFFLMACPSNPPNDISGQLAGMYKLFIIEYQDSTGAW